MTPRKPEPKPYPGRYPNPTAFGILLYTHIAKQGLTVIRFAHMDGLTHGFVCQVYSGLKLPPLDRLETWAKMLKLRGAEREAFLLLGTLAHCPPMIQKTFTQHRKALLKAVDQGFEPTGMNTNALEKLDRSATG